MTETTTAPVRPRRALRTRRAWAALAAILLLSMVQQIGPGSMSAGATTSQSTVLAPVDGAISSNPAEPHHRPYGGDYSFDIHTSRTKRPVFARFRNTNGSLSLTVHQVAPACGSGQFRDGGNRIVLNVLINGAKVGTVAYSHLTSIRYTSGAVPVGAHLGDVATAADGLAASSCWSGPHVHVEPRNDVRYGCYFARPLNSGVDGNTPLGLIGGERAGGVNQVCPSGAETPPGPAPIGEGSFVSHGGHIYRIAGGAPVYVSNWNAVGGPQPATAVADLGVFRRYPADGTLVNAGGFVYRFAGGAPIYVSTWSAIGGSQPSITVDLAALHQAGGAAPWNHVRMHPADGTFVIAGIHVYRFAGGAPIYVSDWAAVGGQQPATRVDPAALANGSGPAPWNHVRLHPINGTFVSTRAGHVYRFAGGAAFHITSWSHVGGAVPTTLVDGSTLGRPSGGGVLNNVRARPVDGTVLEEAPSNRRWVVSAGQRRSTESAAGAVRVSGTSIQSIPVVK